MTRENAEGGRERILVLNPGSTSTKLALFEGERCVFKDSVSHSKEELSQFAAIIDQFEYRRAMVLKFLADKGIELSSLDGVVGRGGLMRPIVSGTYSVNARMLEDVRAGYQGQHASNLGAVLAHDIGESAGAPSFVVDPVVVDELEPIARLSGMPDIPRKSIVHALNVKATARRAALELGRPLSELCLIVTHLGGGISVCAICDGRMVDVSSALSAGPFTPERAGTVPTLELVDMCFSGEHTRAEIRKKLVGAGGLVGYLGTNDAQEIERRIDAGDEEAGVVFDAMIYQVSKEIAAMAAALEGRVDAIVLTGGLAHSDRVTGGIERRAGFIAPVIVMPGEDEMEALASGCLRVLRGEEEALEYPRAIEGADTGA